MPFQLNIANRGQALERVPAIPSARWRVVGLVATIIIVLVIGLGLLYAYREFFTPLH